MDKNHIKERSRIILSPLVMIFSRISPNILTLSGLFIVAIASIFIALGRFHIGAFVLIAGSLLDAIDGEIARKTGKTTTFGAFLDSTLDRYADLFIFLSIAIAGRESVLAVYSIIALLGAYITSYTRARGDSLGVDIAVGLFTREVRIIIIILGLLSGRGFIVYFMILLAIGTNITALQRIFKAYKMIKEGGN
ncbi:CDP-alcohol phosphatidyltransferase family protein [candidate division WOR-3 bacterium]|nr:CDP-alcohol phosphatidyltransferase family protein [candidate division WOR-3 bacterium]